MDKKSYFLQVENLSLSALELFILIDKVKIIIHPNILKQFPLFGAISDFNFTTPDADYETLQSKYTDHDIFFLSMDANINFTIDCADDIVGFVCVPKNNTDYTENKDEFLDAVTIFLSDVCTKRYSWDIQVLDTDNNNVVDDMIYEEDAQKWFEMCKTKYGISQQEIDIAKDAIANGEQLSGFQYAIRDNLPVTLGENDAGQDVIADLYKIKHLLITGRTGRGKTVLLKNVIDSIYAADHINLNCQIVVIDTKNYDFQQFKTNYLMPAILQSPDDAINYLKNITPTIKDTVIFIDELSDIISTTPDIQDTLIKLAQNPKIHIVAATGMPKILSDDFVNAFRHRITFDTKIIGRATYTADTKTEQIKTKPSILELQ